MSGRAQIVALIVVAILGVGTIVIMRWQSAVARERADALREAAVADWRDSRQVMSATQFEAYAGVADRLVLEELTLTREQQELVACLPPLLGRWNLPGQPKTQVNSDAAVAGILELPCPNGAAPPSEDCARCVESVAPVPQVALIRSLLYWQGGERGAAAAWAAAAQRSAVALLRGNTPFELLNGCEVFLGGALVLDAVAAAEARAFAPCAAEYLLELRGTGYLERDADDYEDDAGRLIATRLSRTPLTDLVVVSTIRQLRRYARFELLDGIDAQATRDEQGGPALLARLKAADTALEAGVTVVEGVWQQERGVGRFVDTLYDQTIANSNKDVATYFATWHALQLDPMLMALRCAELHDKLLLCAEETGTLVLRFAVEEGPEHQWVEVECATICDALRTAGRYRLDGLLGSLDVARGRARGSGE